MKGFTLFPDFRFLTTLNVAKIQQKFKCDGINVDKQVHILTRNQGIKNIL